MYYKMLWIISAFFTFSLHSLHNIIHTKQFKIEGKYCFLRVNDPFYQSLQVIQFLRWAGFVMARFFPLPLCPAHRSRSAMAALFWWSLPWQPHTVEDFQWEPPMALDKPLALLNFLLQVKMIQDLNLCTVASKCKHIQWQIFELK